MGFKIVEDRPTPAEVYNWRIYLFAAVAGAGAMTFGYDSAFWGTTLARSSFQTNFGLINLSPDEKTTTTATLTSVYLGAAFFGALGGWPIMETWGRVRAMQVNAVIFLAGATIMTAATTQLSFMYAGRVLTGYAVGGLTAVIPTFIAECSPPPIRGVLTGAFEIAYQVGGLVGFWINYGINQTLDVRSVTSYRIPMAVQLIPGGILAIGTLFLRESPALLLKKGRDEEAIRNLCYLRNLPADHVYILEEVGMVKSRLEDELAMSGGKQGVMGYLRGSAKELRTKSIRHRVVVTFFMFLFQNFSGAAVINYYSPTIFTSLGIKDVALYTGIYGLVKATGCIAFFLFIVDRSGRRVPWLISASSCAACLLYLAIFSRVADPARDTAAANGAIAMVMLYSLFWSFGGNGLPWIVAAELFPVRLRSITGAFAAMTQWLASYASTEAFPRMVRSPMQPWGCFLFYSFVCLLTFAFTFVFIPETCSIPINSMDELFSGPVKYAAWRQKKVYPPHGFPPNVDYDVARARAVMEDAEAGAHGAEKKADVEHDERSL